MGSATVSHQCAIAAGSLETRAASQARHIDSRRSMASARAHQRAHNASSTPPRLVLVMRRSSGDSHWVPQASTSGEHGWTGADSAPAGVVGVFVPGVAHRASAWFEAAQACLHRAAVVGGPPGFGPQHRGTVVGGEQHRPHGREAAEVGHGQGAFATALVGRGAVATGPDRACTSTSCSPTSCDSDSRKRVSATPPPYTRMVAADHSASMPTSPQTRAPWQ